MEELDIKKIHSSKHPLRRKFYCLDELMASILEVGLLEPIVVRPMAGEQKGFEVVAGNRRLEACRRLGMRKIPSFIVELDDREAYEASLVENIQRRTLDLIEEAEGFKKYVDDFGYGGVSELARRIGKSASYVSRRITFLKLPSGVREELLRRRKSPSVAQELLSLDGEDRDMVARLIVEENVTQREVRRIVKQVSTGVRQQVGGRDEEADFVDLQRYYSMEDQRRSTLERSLAKTIVALKLCMERLDDIYQHVDENEWIVREIIHLQRKTVHSQVDQLMNLRTKTMRNPPPPA